MLCPRPQTLGMYSAKCWFGYLSCMTPLFISTNVAKKVVIKLLHSGMWRIQWAP